MVFGWNTQADGEGTVFDKKEPVTASLTVYAQWAKPENLPDKNRWDISRDPSSSATLDNYSYEVDDDGLCTVKVTVGGKPETEADRTWTINAYYHYTGVANKCYEYTFEAWTESGTRDLKVQYYCDNDNRVYLEEHRFPKTTPTSYTIYGGALPKGGLQAINFHLAGQTGTVYIKMIKIKEHPRIILTITGIGSDYGHWLNKAELLDNDWNTVAVSPDIFIGNDGTAMLYFWDVEDDVEDREKPWNIAGDYLILIWFWGKDNDNAWSIYLTEELYTFAENGHYTINFNQFKKLEP